MVYNQIFGNERNARLNKIKIFSSLQSNASPFTFNELIDRTKLYPSTLNKHLKNFFISKFIEKVKIVPNNKNEKYLITDDGYSEYKRLLAEENTEEILKDKNLMDSVKVEKVKIETNDGTYSCQGVVPVSDILNDKRVEALKIAVNTKILPAILREFSKENIDIASASLVLHFCKED